jgi:hypothetical protein
MVETKNKQSNEEVESMKICTHLATVTDYHPYLIPRSVLPSLTFLLSLLAILMISSSHQVISTDPQTPLPFCFCMTLSYLRQAMKALQLHHSLAKVILTITLHTRGAIHIYLVPFYLSIHFSHCQHGDSALSWSHSGQARKLLFTNTFASLSLSFCWK